MALDWLFGLNVFRLLFVIIILVYASYLDIKTRHIPNKFWIILGMTGISLLLCQIIFNLGYLAFYYILPIIPLTILFMSFLVCEGVIDFETRRLNDSWVFLIALGAFSFCYLIFDPTFNPDGQTQLLQLFAPIILFLLYFIFIQILLNYLDFRAYRSYQSLLEKKTAKQTKEIKKRKKTNTQPKKISKISKNESQKSTQKSQDAQEVDSVTLDERISWALFFGLLGFIIIMFLMSDIIMYKPVRTFGLVLLVLIPIFIIILYLWYHSEADTNDNQEMSLETKKDETDNNQDITISIDELQFKPPSKLLYIGFFSSLIFIGFLLIIYYSFLDEGSSLIVQVFIFMIWILMFFGFYNLGLPRGGADTKALMALIILFPVYPIIQYLTIQTYFYSLLDEFGVIGYLFPFAFSVLINAAFIMLFYIISLLIYNASRGDLKVPHALLGYKLPLSEVKDKFVWLMERVKDGKRKLIPFPSSDLDLENELKELKNIGVKKVWVTPKIPFIIPITIGLIITAIIGNILFLIIGLMI